MPLIVATQRTDEWLEARKGKITASHAAAILGLHPRDGPLAAFNAITGITVKKPNGYMEWGREFESIARLAYEVHTGDLVWDTGFWISRTWPWLGASPDGFVGGEGMLEVKCPSKLPVEIPIEHAIQMRVQMEVCERKWYDYFAWTHDAHYLKRIHRDADSDEVLIRQLEAWYEEFIVQNKKPPRRKNGKEKTGKDGLVHDGEEGSSNGSTPHQVVQDAVS